MAREDAAPQKGAGGQLAALASAVIHEVFLEMVAQAEQ
jgi:hypothetical protein